MAGRIRQFIVYSKVTLMIAIGMGVVLVVFMNRGYETRFWPGADSANVSTLWLMLATSVASIAVFWALSRMRRVLRDLAAVRAERAAELTAAEQERVKKELHDQERRIDEKLKRALDGDKSQA